MSASFRSRFELMSRLGGGMSSEVYRARQVGLGRAVILKVFRATGEAAPELLRRFQAEARLLASVDHPRVVTLLDYGTEGDEAYIVYPDEVGVSLDDWRSGERPLPAEEVVRLLDELLDGLDTLHQRGIVHRDLKPANVLVLEDGSVKLLDLGTASQLDASASLTVTGEFLGTPGYASPGQILGEEPDPRNDLYSLGVLAYELLTGENPLRGETMAATLERQLRVVPPPPDARQSGVPRPLALLVMELMAKDPRDRPASARAARQLLARRTAAAVEAPSRLREPPPVRPAPLTGVMVAPGRRSRSRGLRLWQLGLLAGLVVGGIGLGVIVMPPRPEPLPPPSARPTAAPDFESDYPDLLRRELAEASGRWVGTEGSSRPFLDPDPLRWTAVAASLPELGRFHGWLRGGGKPEWLPEELALALREVDREYARRGLPRPFFPFLYMKPEARVEPAAVAALPYLGEPAEIAIPPREQIGGWLAAGALLFAQASRACDQARLKLLDGPLEPELAAVSNPILLSPLTNPRTDLWRFVDWVAPSEDLRTRMHRLMSEAGDLLARALYAAGRSLREEPATRYFVSWGFSTALRVRKGYAALGLMAIDPELLLSGVDETPEGALLLAHALNNHGLLRELVASRQPAQIAAEFAAWRKAANPEGDRSNERRIWSLRVLASRIVQVGDRAGARWLLDELPGITAELPPADSAFVAGKVVELMGYSATDLDLPPDRVAWLLAQVRGGLELLDPEFRETLRRLIPEIEARRRR